ncbi:MAG: hypothetical protein M3076_05080 [Actinomycetota bacterium]|nr:hypothetical protein [Actinomycetota bacterium]
MKLAELLESHAAEPVIAETGWLLDRELGPSAEAAFYRSIADGEEEVEPLARGDWKRIAALTVQYADQHLGGVDAGLLVWPSAWASRRSPRSTAATSAWCARAMQKP